MGKVEGGEEGGSNAVEKINTSSLVLYVSECVL